MKYINRVIITKFRSFGTNETIDCSDLNIFSGGNDSGKSNILKALNLFFNSETDFNVKYNSERDFNKWYRDNNERGERNISIKLFFSKGNFYDKGGINDGFIAERVFYTNGGSDFNFSDLLGKEISTTGIKRANAIVSEKIQYIYIPAIRDLNFREAVQRKIQSVADSSDGRGKNSSLKDALNAVSIGIKDELKELNQYVLDVMGIEVEPTVNFTTLLESLSFDTSEKIKITKRKSKNLETQSVALNSRGDGIQMHFFLSCYGTLLKRIRSTCTYGVIKNRKSHLN
ncbi:hypothetical protein CJD36_018310 [Flavipsychrobacter stenotrophus]|uniref:Endonuclease GajA/Old nuclease/RecF-like AAA domain-containing protein n=1 Tax=Flavipsychrobacter stenotrophus TaxID=2077091 RepID=A0A2S7STM9_9BACT|nr:ATP-binding protein [Flavipsychrobacter stenotrophus]PQJ09876.1 hypothetical protein CJD36_018310 [Flavipsychrobacter stenotrophus]